MTYYGAKELAAGFRTVRKNTIQIAEEIPENKYEFRAAPETRTIGETLAHIAMFKVHEKAQADLARGDHARATTRLRNLATQLLNAGEIELARAALLEAGALMRTVQMSAEGRKRIRYGTRSLSSNSKEPATQDDSL